MVLPAAASKGGFFLRDRAVHVFEEAARVERFRDACRGQAAGAGAAPTLEELGRLMDASHASCRDLYDCSCPELDMLVADAKRFGALGARLTGAGWGGCTVALVREGEVGQFLQSMAGAYFASKGVAEEGMGEVLFATLPAQGGCVLRN